MCSDLNEFAQTSVQFTRNKTLQNYPTIPDAVNTF